MILNWSIKMASFEIGFQRPENLQIVLCCAQY